MLKKLNMRYRHRLPRMKQFITYTFWFISLAQLYNHVTLFLLIYLKSDHSLSVYANILYILLSPRNQPHILDTEPSLNKDALPSNASTFCIS